MEGPVTEQESVESFRARARAFLAANVPRQTERRVVLRAGASEEEELAEIQRERVLQRLLFDGGFAGICFPREYGGLGLTLEHQRAFNEESVGYTMPDIIQIPHSGHVFGYFDDPRFLEIIRNFFD